MIVVEGGIVFMATEVAERESAAQVGNGERERSSISFPYNDLANAVRVAKGVNTIGGSSAQAEQLAAELKVSAKGGAFSLLLLTAKTFGFVTYGKGTIQLTPLGMKLCDPKQERAAKAEGFLTVPLYKAIYEKFKGTTLPPGAALESEMANLGVAKKQTDKARQTFQRSAQQAGFFAHGQDRLVLPGPGPSGGIEPTKEREGEQTKVREKYEDDGGGGGRHQLIEGLIKTLPQEGSEWSLEDRHRWLQLAAGIFDFVYMHKDAASERRVLKIDLAEVSAK
jgi:hypothetical protein